MTDEPVPDAELALLEKTDVVATSGDDGAVLLAQVDVNHPAQQSLSVFVMSSVCTVRVRDRQWTLTSDARLVG